MTNSRICRKAMTPTDSTSYSPCFWTTLSTVTVVPKGTQTVCCCCEKLLVNKNGGWQRSITTWWTISFHIFRINSKMSVKKLEGWLFSITMKNIFANLFKKAIQNLTVNVWHNGFCMQQVFQTLWSSIIWIFAVSM